MTKIAKKEIAEQVCSLLGLALSSKSELFEITIKAADKRSTGWKSQNHHFWGHVRQIAMSTGENLHDVARYVKERAVGMGYPYRIDRWGRLVAKSESDATTQEATILIDACHIVAAELGIILEEGGDE